MRVAEEIAQGGAECFGVLERNEDAALLGQQFLGVPERRADHRLPVAEGVGQRTGGDLLEV